MRELPKTIIFVTKREDLLQAMPCQNCKFIFFDSGGKLIDLKFVAGQHNPDLVVLFGTSIILDRDFFTKYRCINIHCSALPYCRGPAPHVWSFLEMVPPAITIHYPTETLDSGAIITQKYLDIDYKYFTLNSIYHFLHINAAMLLFDSIQFILSDGFDAAPQAENHGTRHFQWQFLALQPILNAHLHTNLPTLRKIVMEVAPFEILSYHNQS